MPTWTTSSEWLSVGLLQIVGGGERRPIIIAAWGFPYGMGGSLLLLQQLELLDVACGRRNVAHVWDRLGRREPVEQALPQRIWGRAMAGLARAAQAIRNLALEFAHSTLQENNLKVCEKGVSCTLLSESAVMEGFSCVCFNRKSCLRFENSCTVRPVKDDTNEKVETVQLSLLYLLMKVREAWSRRPSSSWQETKETRPCRFLSWFWRQLSPRFD